jgi:hypothetical protein
LQIDVRANAVCAGVSPKFNSDVSAGGIKVIAEHLDVPSEFTIIMSEGRPRQCRLAWRIGYEFGAQFVD